MKKKSILKLFCYTSVFSLLVVSTGFVNHSINLPLSKVKWSAQDSTIVDKLNGTVSLYGKAKFTCDKFSLSANEIVYHKKQQKVIAKNYVITTGDNRDTKGNYGEFFIKD